MASSNSQRPPAKAGKAGAAAGFILVAGVLLQAASPELMQHLTRWESGQKRVLVVYADKLARGIPTVCNGLTRHVTSTPIIVGEKWTDEKCEAEERAEEEARHAEQERARLAAEAAAQQQAKAEKAATVKPVATVEEMERYLLASIAAEPSDLADLASARARRVRDVLLAEGNIAPDRVRIAEVQEGEGTVRGPQARLHFR